MGAKGTLSTAGMACRLNRRDQEDSLVLACLRAAGALPLCTSNVMQILMMAEWVNCIWGTDFDARFHKGMYD